MVTCQMRLFKLNIYWTLVVVGVLSICACTPRPPAPESVPQGRTQEVARRTTSGIVRDWLTDFKPFSPHPAIDYYVSDSCRVLILIKNAQGKTMDTLVNQWRGKGLYSAGWHPNRGWTNGAYIYEFKAGEIRQTKKTYLKFADDLERGRK